MHPELDLSIEVELNIPLERVWRAWTQADLLQQWLCPRPWRVAECEVDLRPGGLFRFVLQGPDGERHEHRACWLEIVPGQRLVWTTALLPDFRPAPAAAGVPPFTAVIELEARGSSTVYRATARHADAAACAAHAAMGFHEGWRACAAQLAEVQEA